MVVICTHVVFSMEGGLSPRGVLGLSALFSLYGCVFEEKGYYYKHPRGVRAVVRQMRIGGLLCCCFRDCGLLLPPR